MSDLAREKIPKLSKSRFLAGLQCPKRLYLECFHRELADPVDVGQQAILDAGTRVGEFARNLYADGLSVADLRGELPFPYFRCNPVARAISSSYGNTNVPPSRFG